MCFKGNISAIPSFWVGGQASYGAGNLQQRSDYAYVQPCAGNQNMFLAPGYTLNGMTGSGFDWTSVTPTGAGSVGGACGASSSSGAATASPPPAGAAAGTAPAVASPPPAGAAVPSPPPASIAAAASSAGTKAAAATPLAVALCAALLLSS